MLRTFPRLLLLLATSLLLALASAGPVRAGVGRWTSAGPPDPGAAHAVSFDPLTPGTLYLKTQAGGLYVSTDGGDHWRHLDAAPAGLEPPFGIYRSLDAGASWSALSAGLPDPEQVGGNACVHDLLVDPSSPGLLFAACHGAGIARSLDGGDTWSLLNPGLGNLTVKALALEPASGRLWAATDGNGLYVGVFEP
jgi:photosystem II stability/assembly factor-like uncharacterized protein